MCLNWPLFFPRNSKGRVRVRLRIPTKDVALRENDKLWFWHRKLRMCVKSLPFCDFLYFTSPHRSMIVRAKHDAMWSHIVRPLSTRRWSLPVKKRPLSVWRTWGAPSTETTQRRDPRQRTTMKLQEQLSTESRATCQLSFSRHSQLQLSHRRKCCSWTFVPELGWWGSVHFLVWRKYFSGYVHPL